MRKHVCVHTFIHRTMKLYIVYIIVILLNFFLGKIYIKVIFKVTSYSSTSFFLVVILKSIICLHTHIHNVRTSSRVLMNGKSSGG